MTVTEQYLVLAVIKNIAFLGLCAYVTAQLPAFRRALSHDEYRLRDKVLLMLVFGAFSGIGNYLSIPIMGSLANCRIVGAVAGGLLGGPAVGLGAGIVGGIPRYFMGGFTMPAAVLSNAIAGLLSGFIGNRYGPRRLSLTMALGAGLGGEMILKGLVLTMSKPFAAAWALERVIGPPTIVANCLGVVMFVYIIQDVFREQVKAQAQSAQQAMRVIHATNGLLRDGLNAAAAQKIAHIIYQTLKPAAVAVTDREKVLAFIGCGADHHQVGGPVMTAVTRSVLQTHQTVIVNDKAGVGCPCPDCPLTGAVETPLLVGQELLGCIKIFKIRHEAVSPYEAELIQGIGSFLSLQLAQAKLDQQAALLAQAEYSLLKAQVNPHFLFNTLGTIKALIKTNPVAAQSMLKDLAVFLRKTLNREQEIIPLAEELETVHTYVRLEKVRFGPRLTVSEEIPVELLTHPVPVFFLQPLVENAVKHGLFAKKEGGMVKIAAWHDEKTLFVAVEDNGVGMSQQHLSKLKEINKTGGTTGTTGIGIKNVHQRIQKLYGPKFGLHNKFSVEKGDHSEIIDSCQIELIYAKDRQVFIRTVAGETFRAKLTLQEFEHRLDPHKFFRCHRNYIVNIDMIKQIVPWFNRGYMLILNCGQEKNGHVLEVPVSRFYVHNLKKYILFS